MWIFGSPRSGSTWLLQLLGQHPAVVPINEPLIGWYLSPFLSDLPGRDPTGLDETNFTMRQVEQRNPSQFFAAEFADVWRPGLARMMRKRFAAHVARYPARVPPSRALVAIKEPNGSQSADLLSEALPRSRFLFLLRDGRDVVDSELAAHLKGGWATSAFPGSEGLPDEERLDFIRQSAMKWLWRTQVTERAFAAHAGPKRRIRYEDLLTDPEGRMRGLLQWLGIDLEDHRLRELVDSQRFERMPDELKGPKGFYRSGRAGSWRDNLSAEEQEVLSGALGEKLAELGY